MTRFEKNIREFPRQLSAASLETLGLGALRGTKADGVIVAGMGGSGIPGEIARAHAEGVGLNIPIVLHKAYGLPAPKKLGISRPLYVFASFSGNTQETLSGFAEARRRGARIAVITGGGSLKRLAERHRVPMAAFDPGHLTPRQASGIMFYALIEILHAARVLAKPVPDLTRLNTKTLERDGRLLAGRVSDGPICIYTDASNAHLGYFWKISFNETAKALAFTNVLPESSHNEIVAFELPRNRATVLLLSPPRMSGFMKKEFSFVAKLLRERGVGVLAVPIRGDGLGATWRSVMLAEWTAFYLAKKRRIAPEPTHIIEDLKTLMR